MITIKDFCTNHTGKMTGMISLSTSCTLNTFCPMRRKVEGSICQHCYACAMTQRYTALNKKLERNYHLLKENDFTVDDMPKLNALTCRLESFGDVDNIQQVKNYFTLCNANQDTTFTVWTKNPEIYKNTMDTYGIEKPKNLIIILSSIMVNRTAKVHHDFIDKVFTVFDKATAKEVNINCGAKSCATCQRCYRKTDGIEYINEIIK